MHKKNLKKYFLCFATQNKVNASNLQEKSTMSNQDRQLLTPLALNQADPKAMSQNILVLGAGELGLPVLRGLAQRAKNIDGVKISVLLRASAVVSSALGKQHDIAEIRGL